MKSTATLLATALLAFSLTSPSPARATLGEPADSIAQDQKSLSAVHRATTTKPSYTVQEIASDATTLREYINEGNIVFAVAWNGLMHPDLTKILGVYTDDFKTAKKKLRRKHGQKRLRIQGSDVVVETWGHMRNLQGRAYVPSLMPAGVTANEIK